MAVSAVDERGERATLELQQRRIRALRGPLRVPVAGLCADGNGPRAGEQAHDVDLVRGLAERRAATRLGRELLGPPQAIEKVGEIERGDHPHPAEAAFHDEPARFLDRPVEAVTVADDEPDVRGRAGRNHPVAFGERDRHRLLHQHVLARCRGDFRVCGVDRMRGGDVDHFRRRIAGERLDCGVGARAEVRGEALPCLGARIGRGDELDARVGARTSGSMSVNARPRPATPMRSGAGSSVGPMQYAPVHRSSTSTSDRARDTQIMMWSACSSGASTRSRCSGLAREQEARLQVPQVPLSHDDGTDGGRRARTASRIVTPAGTARRRRRRARGAP